MIFDLHRSYNSIEFLYTHYCISPRANIPNNHNTPARTKNSTECNVIYQTIHSVWISPVSHYCLVSAPWFNLGGHILLNCVYLVSSELWQVLSLSCLSWPWHFHRVLTSYFTECASIWILWFFLWVSQGYIFFTQI